MNRIKTYVVRISIEEAYVNAYTGEYEDERLYSDEVLREFASVEHAKQLQGFVENAVDNTFEIVEDEEGRR